MKVVITGAGGYIGAVLVRRLNDLGVSVAALSRGSSKGEYVCLMSGASGTLQEHMVGASSVIHLAGVLVKDPKAPIRDYMEANVLLTDEVMRAAIEAGIRNVVHASSRLVYPSTLEGPALESDARPDTPYGLSKLWAEDTVRYHCERSGISGISLRLGQVTGGNHPGLGVINRFIRQAADTGVIRVSGSGRAQRDIIHVRDAAGALVKAMEYRGKWRPVNVGGTAPVTIAELAQKVRAVVGEDRVRVVHEPVAVEDRSCYALHQKASLEYLKWSAAIDASEIISEAWKDQERAQ